MNQIRYFLSLCEHRNFTHAAHAANVSQPALTTAIRKLEDELGGPLFLRDRSGCALTALGRLVRPRFERLVAEAQEAKAQAIRHVRLDRVPIAIGIGETIGHERITRAIARYREGDARADIELIVDDGDSLLSGLRDGRFDLVIATDDVPADTYRADLLYREGYRLVMGADHPLAALSVIPVARLAEADLLDRPNCEMREALAEAVTAAGGSLYAAYRSNRVDWLLRLAANGNGIVVLPETSIPDDPALTVRAFSDMTIEREVKALRHRHQPSRPETLALLRLMQSG